ncbi:MAG: hypothetical protein KF764_13715 [Labilithrix sp.]|nr:hypothetical protein [Labilithrix sp.]
MRREPSSLARLIAGLFVAGASAMVALGGCGSRGPLDEATNVTLDAAPEAEPAPVDAAPDADPPVRDAGREAGPVACGICVLTTCGDTILSCIQSEGCRAVFQCVASTCLGGGGGLDPLCLFQCAGQDPTGALGVLSVFQCITGQCGADCGSLLGGLGGLGGGGSSSGGSSGGGSSSGGNGGKGAPEAFHELFSPWPELFSPAPIDGPPGGAGAPPIAPRVDERR